MAAIISPIQLYTVLREKIGDQQAQTLTDYVTQKIDETFQQQKSSLATKEDIADLKTKIVEAKNDTIKWVFAFFVTVMLTIVGLWMKR